MSQESPYHHHIAQDGSRSPSLINRCNLPPFLIASEEFQDNPSPIELDGVKITDRWLFQRLEQIDDPEERGRVFHDYICVKFGLNEWAQHHAFEKSKSVTSYVNFLHSWGSDSNGHAGAVLKAWVESRFGLLATFHNGRLAEDVAACEAFMLDRMRGAAKSIGVLMQLDLLYTFCQVELRRRFPGERWKTLYRGTHDPEEYSVHTNACPNESPSSLSSGTALMQLNNLSSFTSDPEVAWEFGSSVWKVEVPLPKIVFFSGLLPKSLLTGESEYLVLGGHYKVRTLLY
jgi:NAD+--dinitrogen-reductase ADP-D-ribosyltransferase